MARPTELSGWPHDSQEPEAESSPAPGVDTKPKKTEKEPQARRAPSPAKERLKAGATPRSVPARKKAQSAPPPSEWPPWGDVTLNKCLALASLLALLGSALQLCRDAVAGEEAIPALAPEPWVLPSAAPKERGQPPPPPAARAPPSGPPAPQVEAGERPEVARDREAAEKSKEATGQDDAPLADPGPKEKPPGRKWRKEARPRKERPGKEERPRREGRPRAAREPREVLPRSWEARQEGRRPWERDSGDPGRRKRRGSFPGRAVEEDRPLGRQKRRGGKGRDRAA
ncbi:junctional sarcoplasmic reticulum protein 1 [Choloepus didactylus]|uniref:junctional sarcoplasmic reticulum protein 1 n=1 Tax=Choloepus didactylus TaxID=27675 RepID=UPI00189F1858|nr:junctional sarcoplasmic reticulum protein 1 [Choloepus didactylus]